MPSVRAADTAPSIAPNADSRSHQEIAPAGSDFSTTLATMHVTDKHPDRRANGRVTRRGAIEDSAEERAAPSSSPARHRSRATGGSHAGASAGSAGATAPVAALEPKVRSATSIGTAATVPTGAAAPVATDAGHSGPTAKVATRVVEVTTSPTVSADAAGSPPPIVTVAALARHAGRGVGTSARTSLDVAADAHQEDPTVAADVHHDDPTVAADLQGRRSAAGVEDGAARQTGVVRNDGVASPSVAGDPGRDGTAPPESPIPSVPDVQRESTGSPSVDGISVRGTDIATGATAHGAQAGNAQDRSGENGAAPARVDAASSAPQEAQSTPARSRLTPTRRTLLASTAADAGAGRALHASDDAMAPTAAAGAKHRPAPTQGRIPLTGHAAVAERDAARDAAATDDAGDRPSEGDARRAPTLGSGDAVSPTAVRSHGEPPRPVATPIAGTVADALDGGPPVSPETAPDTASTDRLGPPGAFHAGGALEVRDARTLAAAPPSTSTDATISPWAERVVESVRVATLRGGGEMRLRLEPAGLGHIDVRITLAHDGIHAAIVAEHDSTRALLRSEQHLLHAALERSELRLAGFSVDVGSGSASSAFAEARDGAMALRRDAAPAGEAEVAPEQAAAIATHAPATAGPGHLSVRV